MIPFHQRELRKPPYFMKNLLEWSCFPCSVRETLPPNQRHQNPIERSILRPWKPQLACKLGCNFLSQFFEREVKVEGKYPKKKCWWSCCWPGILGSGSSPLKEAPFAPSFADTLALQRLGALLAVCPRKTKHGDDIENWDVEQKNTPKW